MDVFNDGMIERLEARLEMAAGDPVQGADPTGCGTFGGCTPPPPPPGCNCGICSC